MMFIIFIYIYLTKIFRYMHVYALSMYLCWHHHLSMEPCSIGFLLWILFSYFNLWLIVLCARVFDFVSALLIRYLKIVSEYLCCVFLILFPSCLLNFLIIQIFFIYWANWKAYLVGLSILLQFGTGKTSPCTTWARKQNMFSMLPPSHVYQ